MMPIDRMEDHTLEAIRYFNLDVIEINTVRECATGIVKILKLVDGKTYVLKSRFPHNELIREKNALEALQDKFPVPKVINYWKNGETAPGMLLLSCLPGKSIRSAEPPEISYELGKLLGQLHLNKLITFGDLFHPTNNAPTTWWQMIDGIFRRNIPACAAVIPNQVLEKLLRKYDGLLVHLPEPDGPCVVHFDYHPGNVLIQSDGELAGLIDFESACSGSADIDFVKFKEDVWNQCPSSKKPFLQGYASVRKLPPIETTMPFYELHQAFQVVASCIRRNWTNTSRYHEHLKKLYLFANT